MSWSGREALSNVWECPGVVRRPPGCPGVVGRPSRMSGSVWEWSGGHAGVPGAVGRPSLMSWSGQDVLPYVRERMGGPL